MISNHVVGRALLWWNCNNGLDADNIPIAEWRKARNKWLQSHGICGIIKNGKMSRSFPTWWPDGTQFWFRDRIDEQLFIDRWK